jgi:CreA protein
MKSLFLAAVLISAAIGDARADDVGCISTTFNLVSPNDKVCVSSFEDPKVPGIACFISQARKGGWGQPLGLNEDPSNFSISCHQMGPITIDISKLPQSEEAFTEKTSMFFKATRVYRLPDTKTRTLVYLAISSKIVNGSPANAVSAVLIVPWPSP